MIDLKNPRTFSRPHELAAQVSSQALIGHNTAGIKTLLVVSEQELEVRSGIINRLLEVRFLS